MTVGFAHSKVLSGIPPRDFGPASEIAKLTIFSGSCQFADGMRWSSGFYFTGDSAHPETWVVRRGNGAYYAADPLRPGTWIPTSPSYLPGNPRQLH
jgi:hypothetical protein